MGRLSIVSTIPFQILGVLFLIIGLAACAPDGGPLPPPATTPTPTPTAAPDPPPEAVDRMELGLNSINGPGECAHLVGCGVNTDPAKALGATWDRWPVQWYWVEQPGRDGVGKRNEFVGWVA